MPKLLTRAEALAALEDIAFSCGKSLPKELGPDALRSARALNDELQGRILGDSVVGVCIGLCTTLTTIIDGFQSPIATAGSAPADADESGQSDDSG